jgi:hypothetical protein
MPEVLAAVMAVEPGAPLTHTVIHSDCEHFPESIRIRDLAADPAG